MRKFKIVQQKTNGIRLNLKNHVVFKNYTGIPLKYTITKTLNKQSTTHNKFNKRYDFS